MLGGISRSSGVHIRHQVGGPILLALLAAAAAIIIVALRAIDSIQNPQFYGEEFWFWLQQYRFGFLHSVVIPVGGYICLAQRLIALAADVFPLSAAPAIYAYAAIAVSGWTAAVIALSPLPRVLGLVLAITPFAIVQSPEVIGTALNTQWIMAIGIPFLMVGKPHGRTAKIMHGVFLVVSHMSGPFSIAAAPIWLARAWHARRKKANDAAYLAAMAGTGIACATVQTLVLFAEHLRPSVLDRTKPWGTLPELLSNRIIADPNWLVAGVVVIFLLVCLTQRGRLQLVTVLCLAYATFLMAMTDIRFSGAMLPPRYYDVPATMIVLTAVAALASMSIPLRAVAMLLLIGMVATNAPRFARPMRINHADEWIAAAPRLAVNGGKITIAPSWHLEVPPCWLDARCTLNSP